MRHSFLVARAPLLAAALFAGVCAFLLGDWILPGASFRAEQELGLVLEAGLPELTSALGAAQAPPASEEDGFSWQRGTGRLWALSRGQTREKAEELSGELRQGVIEGVVPALDGLLRRTRAEARARLPQLERDRSVAAQAAQLEQGAGAHAFEQAAREAEAERGRIEALAQSLERTTPRDYLARKVSPPQAQRAEPVARLDRKLQLGILAASLGLLSLAGAWIVHRNDTRFFTCEETRERLRLPVLGTVPRLKPAPGSTRERPVLDPGQTFDPLADAVEAAVRQGGVRSLTVVSALEGEGRTTLAAGLARALAARGKKVLLIEGNLVEPRLHVVLGLPPGPGLAEMLELTSRSETRPAEVYGALTEAQVAALASASGAESPHVIRAGHTAAPIPHLLTRERLQPLLLRLGRTFDLIICDSRPLFWGGDAAQLAASTDAALLVVEARRTEGRDVAWARFILQESQVTVMGTVLNQCQEREASKTPLHTTPPAAA